MSLAWQRLTVRRHRTGAQGYRCILLYHTNAVFRALKPTFGIIIQLVQGTTSNLAYWCDSEGISLVHRVGEHKYRYGSKSIAFRMALWAVRCET